MLGLSGAAKERCCRCCSCRGRCSCCFSACCRSCCCRCRYRVACCHEWRFLALDRSRPGEKQLIQSGFVSRHACLVRNCIVTVTCSESLVASCQAVVAGSFILTCRFSCFLARYKRSFSTTCKRTFACPRSTSIDAAAPAARANSIRIGFEVRANRSRLRAVPFRARMHVKCHTRKRTIALPRMRSS